MFYYFNGEVTLLESNLAVIDCGGVGYACRTSSYTLSRLHVGERARLYTYCSIREDAFDIYGFSTREELRNFELLLGVTGVGAKAALAILSSTTPDRFALAIFSQDEKALTAAPGVGKKLAQRILLELKDKLGGAAPAEGGISLPAGDVPAASGSALALAQAALAELGYRPQEITAALRSFDPEGMKTEEIVRWTQGYDPTRPVNPASGGNHYPCGDMLDLHHYPDPQLAMYDPGGRPCWASSAESDV